MAPGANCEEVKEAMGDMDDTPPRKERERTPEELRCSPKLNKKMKIEKLGEQQHERSCSLPHKASLKSVKA